MREEQQKYSSGRSAKPLLRRGRLLRRLRDERAVTHSDESISFFKRLGWRKTYVSNGERDVYNVCLLIFKKGEEEEVP